MRSRRHKVSVRERHAGESRARPEALKSNQTSGKRVLGKRCRIKGQGGLIGVNGQATGWLRKARGGREALTNAWKGQGAGRKMVKKGRHEKGMQGTACWQLKKMDWQKRRKAIGEIN